MSFFEKMFNKKEAKEENEASVETTNEVVNESEAEANNENVEKAEADLAKLEAIAIELGSIDAEKAAKNIEANENLRKKLKVAAGVLTTLGFAAAMTLAFTERVEVTDIIKNMQSGINELMLGVTFVATAVSGAMTHEFVADLGKANKQSDNSAVENNPKENSQEGFAA